MKCLLLACLMVAAMMSSDAQAKRVEPKAVPPVVKDGIKYSAPHEKGAEAIVVAQDEQSGKPLWKAVIYTITPKPDLEEDVQWVFITNLALHDGKLIVTNEKQEHFALDLATHTVQKLK